MSTLIEMNLLFTRGRAAARYDSRVRAMKYSSLAISRESRFRNHFPLAHTLPLRRSILPPSPQPSPSPLYTPQCHPAFTAISIPGCDGDRGIRTTRMDVSGINLQPSSKANCLPLVFPRAETPYRGRHAGGCSSRVDAPRRSRDAENVTCALCNVIGSKVTVAISYRFCRLKPVAPSPRSRSARTRRCIVVSFFADR